MKIAVTSQNGTTLSDHAGQCSTFWIYHAEYADVADKKRINLPQGEDLRRKDLPKPLRGINVLITGGISEHLRYRLKQQAVQVIATLETDPDRAVQAWLNGTLDEIPPFLHCGEQRPANSINPPCGWADNSSHR